MADTPHPLSPTVASAIATGVFRFPFPLSASLSCPCFWGQSSTARESGGAHAACMVGEGVWLLVLCTTKEGIRLPMLQVGSAPRWEGHIVHVPGRSWPAHEAWRMGCGLPTLYTQWGGKGVLRSALCTGREPGGGCSCTVQTLEMWPVWPVAPCSPEVGQPWYKITDVLLHMCSQGIKLP